jgi:hypothetical protein
MGTSRGRGTTGLVQKHKVGQNKPLHAGLTGQAGSTVINECSSPVWHTASVPHIRVFNFSADLRFEICSLENFQ